ncbi:sodium:solute symporter family protein [Nocardioides euryhalodurans]|uniref:Sodium:solute symporter n=1 Tax=Nocardioides euryhalodurans TaxID=2518370 RepID=A0A4P7GLT7_9ACTN|nr:sodium:solute symporter [Nocardioides euryhalodurans]QBR93108.1 sodium:solute symporter [Nocardioides euryhalodurans]
MSSAITIVLVYFALMLGIGAWARSRVTSSKDFLVAGQTLGFLVMAVGTFSSIQSGFGMIGHTANTYAWGVQALVAAALFVPLSFALSWFLLGSRLYRLARHHDVYSVPDVIRLRYPGRAAHLSMSVAMFVGSVAYMTAQVTAIGVIMSLIFGTSVTVGAIVGSAVVALYTVVGGMLAGAWTDFVQGLLMVAMSVGVFVVSTNTLGGWGATLDTIAAQDVSFLRLDGSQPLTYVFTFVLLAILGAAAQPQLVTKFLMLRSPSELKWGALVAAVAYAVTTLFALGIGLTMRGLTMTGRAPELDNIDNTATWYLDSMVSPAFAGFVLAGLLAAIMSSANSFIAVGASALMRDLTGALGITVRHELRWARIASTFVVLCSLVFALYLSQVVFILGAIGWAAFAAAIFGPLVLGLYWRRATALATTVAVTFGIVANLLVTILTTEGVLTLPAYFQAGGAVICLGILIFVALSVAVPSADSSRQFVELGVSASDGLGGHPRRVDTLVAVAFLTIGAATAGMVWDWWQPVYYAVPVLTTSMMLLGALNRAGRWSRSSVTQIALFGAATLVLFAAAHATAEGTGTIGGLPTTTALFFYVLWPLTTVVPSLIFVSVYRGWLRHDLVDLPTAGPAQASLEGRRVSP